MAPHALRLADLAAAAVLPAAALCKEAISVCATSAHAAPAIPTFQSKQLASVRRTSTSRTCTRICAKKANEVDPEDLPTNGSIMGEGKQDFLEPRPPTDPTSENGYLLFPDKVMPEVASLGLYIRDDVRRCCCLVKGGVFENLVFFPVIQFLKDRYPGVRIDVYASSRGKQVYELNKNIRRAFVYDLDEQYASPVDWTETLGKIKNENYDMVLSTRPAGLGMSMFLWLTDARQKVSYVFPNVNGAGSGLLLSGAVPAPAVEISELGYNMYADLLAYLDRPAAGVPSTGVSPPLEVGVSRLVREAAAERMRASGKVLGGDYIVVHGLASRSSASMVPSGDADSLLSLDMWASITQTIGSKALYVIPNEDDRDKAKAAFGENASIVQIATPGQLAAVIQGSRGVISTNTAALQLAVALEKPSVGLFGSADKATKFVPNAELKGCTLVASSSGALSGIDVKEASGALSDLTRELLPV